MDLARLILKEKDKEIVKFTNSETKMFAPEDPWHLVISAHILEVADIYEAREFARSSLLSQRKEV